MTPIVIDQFRGEYSFLSNFHFSPIVVDKFSCATAEHAYQGLKAMNAAERNYVLVAATAQEAKNRGRSVKAHEGWDIARVQVMRKVLEAKFTQHPELALRLVRTGEATLIEGNSWHDQYWGDCRCPTHQATQGENHLGRLLMELRTRLGARYPYAYIEPESKSPIESTVAQHITSKGTSHMKAQDIKDVLALQGLLADHGYNEVCDDSEALAALMDWKSGWNGSAPEPEPVAAVSTPRATTKTEAPKRGRPRKAVPAPEPTPDPSDPDMDF